MKTDKNPLRLKIIQTINEKELICKNDSILVALSGGADSTALLHLLISVKEKYKIKIGAVHINHRIRGEESDRDESFCAELCKNMKIPFYTEKHNIPELAEITKKSLELAAREVRYEVFIRTAKAYGYNKIATAHNKNDNGETVVFNMIRGTGMRGLKGIPYKRGNIIRPFLDITRDEIIKFLAENNNKYCCDSTNYINDYTRNRIRNKIIPLMQEENPAFIDTVSNLTELMTIDDDYFNIQLENSEESNIKNWHNSLLNRYVFNKIQRVSNIVPDYKTLKSIVRALKSSKNASFDISGGIKAITKNGQFHICKNTELPEKIPEIQPVVLKYGENIFEHGLFKINIFDKEPKNFNQINNFSTIRLVCSVNIDDSLVLRKRLPGDKIRINGMTKLVKKAFIDKKIPRNLRSIIPVICHKSEIVCVPFMGTDDRFKNGNLIYIYIEFLKNIIK